MRWTTSTCYGTCRHTWGGHARRAGVEIGHLSRFGRSAPIPARASAETQETIETEACDNPRPGVLQTYKPTHNEAGERKRGVCLLAVHAGDRCPRSQARSSWSEQKALSVRIHTRVDFYIRIRCGFESVCSISTPQLWYSLNLTCAHEPLKDALHDVL